MCIFSYEIPIYLNTFKILAKNNDMKKWTKILLAVFVATLIPAIVFGRDVFLSIKPNGNSFGFDFTTKAIIGLVFMGVSMTLGMILYIRFLLTLSLDKVLFFSSFPLLVVYGVSIFFIASVGTMEGDFAQTLRTMLNITDTASYNTILWSVLVTITLIVLLLLNFIIICRPLTRVERIVLRLGDGLVKDNKLCVGGGKQFEAIEHGLNKINSNYKEKEYSLKDIDFSSPIPKHFYKFLGRGNVEKLQRGEVVKQSAIVLFVRMNSQNGGGTLTMEESFGLVNSYLNIISPLIRKEGGFIEKFTGDSVIGVFAKAGDGIKCCQNISKIIEAKNISKRGMPDIDYKIIVSGFELSYKLENSNGSTYPVILNPLQDDLVRLYEVAEFVGSNILYTKSCIERLPLDSRLEYRYMGFVSLSGGQVVLYDDLQSKPRHEQKIYQKTKRQFERGVIAFNQGRFDEAENIFSQILHLLPKDKASYEYFNKCKEKLRV